MMMRIVLAQINPTVGDVVGNAECIADALDSAREAMAASGRTGPLVVAAPELAVLGYPPKDLLLKEGLVERCEAAVAEIAARCCTGDVIGLIPSPRRRERQAGTGITNALAICRNGRIEHWYDKRLLPTYDVFDEDRYFDPGSEACIIEVGGSHADRERNRPQNTEADDATPPVARIGITLCEDLWIDEVMLARRLYAEDTVADLLAHPGGAPDLIVNCSASPFVVGKPAFRADLFRRIARRANCPLAFVNMVGGNDDLVFDGHSFWLGEDDEIAAAPGFAEHTLIMDWSPGGGQAVTAVDSEHSGTAADHPATRPALIGLTAAPIPDLNREDDHDTPTPPTTIETASAGPLRRPIPVSTRAELEADDDGYPPAFESEANLRDLFHALVLGTRDYLRKCGFNSAIVALSGGIDSTIVAAIAVAALGADKVHGIGMPSRYSSPGSVDDARDLAERLGIRFDVISIEPAHEAMLSMMEPLFVSSDRPPGVAEENIQARLRGNIVMSWSNKIGSMLLTTGNKSEIAVGYCTLYGDMAGGLAVISDVPKTVVYDLCRFLNSRHTEFGFATPPIPESVIEKPPSAELRPDQKDEDSLPPYPILDAIIFRYVERLESVENIIERTNFDPDLIRRICRLIDRNEYKRRQMPTGLKVTGRAFGTGWRMPIAARVTTG